ncbi:hypothetical protein F477_03619 [Pseudomonas sp. URIL14HWK12:I3]|uniref:hypothetical protein n=1 Tax=unclassified Pseudomonas TaxID=196821 RepID=UPI000DAF4383|nr:MULTISPECIES: hypothetical protein [unclassified Pseudomonas]MBK4989780.1 hypothetical protein [Pseudomonas sp. S36]MCP3791573.1 hypothetical protein [Pseudomonas sp. N2-11]PZW52773.1 hypothetical protein F478_02568 [Pseudomonas sp. URIL14HWK12:I2]PZW53518.1 hypothetical protein F477_03619 [Pseudomonas sp. URIL14HWK12:I3]
MTNVTRLRHVLPMPADVVAATNALDSALIKAIDAAKEAGLPQGLLVAILHGHAHAETRKMVG